MKKYTKLFIGTLCFLSSAAVFAGGCRTDLKGEVLMPVTIPTLDGGANVSAGALYMQPYSSNVDYLATYTDVDGGSNHLYNWQHYRVDPNFKWGFTVGLGYVMPNSAHDLRVDWMSFHNSYTDNQELLATDNNNLIATFLPVNAVALNPSAGLDPVSKDVAWDLLKASGKMEYGFDAVDVTFGQYVNVGKRLQARMFAGVRYATLDSDMTTEYAVRDFQSSVDLYNLYNLDKWNGKINSSWNGVGPLFGGKGTYALGHGVNLVAMFDLAVLVGNVKLNAYQKHLSGEFDKGNDCGSCFDLEDQSNYHLNWNGLDVVSPAFDGKFGVNFEYDFRGVAAVVEVGYQVSHYVDVIEQIDRGSTSVTEIGTSSPYYSYDNPKNFTTDVTDFGLNGMYLNFSFKM